MARTMSHARHVIVTSSQTSAIPPRHRQGSCLRALDWSRRSRSCHSTTQADRGRRIGVREEVAAIDDDAAS